jgi:murein DD-endopeptidase MepM/ murein hydrolase activator NlpD
VADRLDFPLDPPDAEEAWVVMGFGRAGSRYHSGDDWLLTQASSFGASVHSTGHGQVTYAESYGWGADGGVVIVRHTFADRSTILSFYGHLHPSSIALNAGDCVARGDRLGTLGKPRTPPHLHFEIRSAMPGEPGRGYSSSDPTRAGWEAPAQYIWNRRLAASPGARWTRPLSGRATRILGRLNPDTFVALEDGDLIAVDVRDGSLRWRHPISERPGDATLNAGRSAVYVINGAGRLEAYRLAELEEAGTSPGSQPSVRPAWRIDLDVSGAPGLAPLPGGGVAVSVRRVDYRRPPGGKGALSIRRQMVAVSAGGRRLWELNVAAPSGWSPQGDRWLLTGGRLVYTTGSQDADVWTIDEARPAAWGAHVGGRPFLGDGKLYVYDPEGVYRLDPETRSAELVYGLPRAYPGPGDMLALPGGGLLVAHGDRYDRRLIALNADGTLRWQRSYAGLPIGQPQLLMLGRRPYLVLRNDTVSATTLTVFAIDLERPALTRISSAAGPRASRPADTAALALDPDGLLVNLGGGGMVAIDPPASGPAARQ